jgi:hypothetical protein
VLAAAHYDDDLARYVTALANQNLGIRLYEQVCEVFRDEAPPLAILQTGLHSVHVSSSEEQRSVKVQFEACFKLSPFDCIDDPFRCLHNVTISKYVAMTSLKYRNMLQ